jgi:hypothetical protein
MAEELKELSLPEVLDEMAASEPVLDARALTRWMERYPQYEREIMDFAARLGLMTHLPPDDTPLEDEEGFYSRGLEVVRRVMDARRSREARDEAPITSLIAEAKGRNLDVTKLAAAADLSVPIIVKFEQRLISFASIPREAIEALARTVQRSAESVAAYLQTAPGFAPGASYKSESAPKLPPQQDFSEAVRSDRTLAEEKKSVWLERAARAGRQD